MAVAPITDGLRYNNRTENRMYNRMVAAHHHAGDVVEDRRADEIALFAAGDHGAAAVGQRLSARPPLPINSSTRRLRSGPIPRPIATPGSGP